MYSYSLFLLTSRLLRAYDHFMGVATMFSKEAYLAINGFGNNYYGWGYLVLRARALSLSLCIYFHTYTHTTTSSSLNGTLMVSF